MKASVNASAIIIDPEDDTAAHIQCLFIALGRYAEQCRRDAIAAAPDHARMLWLLLEAERAESMASAMDRL